MNEPLLLGVDLGTSYFKLGLFNGCGETVGLARTAVAKDAGDGSLCQLDAELFWSLLKSSLAEACEQARATPAAIQAVSYASQANSFLLLDRELEPLTPIILWCDNRAQNMAQVHELFNQADFLQRTGLGLASDHQFCAAKIAWLKKHAPELWAQAACLLTISDYFTFGLTQEPAGDAGTASLLGFLNVHTLQWQHDIVDPGHVRLATPLRPGTVAGTVTAKGAERLGVAKNIPVVVGSLDHHMAALGAGLGCVAEMSESTGTVLACLRQTDVFLPRQNICTGVGMAKGCYYQLAFDGNGAAAWEWYHANHAGAYSMKELEQLAAAVAIGSDGMVALANSHTFGGLAGFRRYTSAHQPGHFSRAIMESTAASLKPLVDHLSQDQLPAAIVATGGAAHNDLWLQIKADLLGIEYVRTETRVPTCLGAAMLAAIALGWFADLDAISRQWIKIQKRFSVHPEHHRQYLCWLENRSSLTSSFHTT